jgi:hypothetical protein
VLRLVVLSPDSEPEFGSAERHLVLSAPDGSPVAYGWRIEDDHWLSLSDIATFRFQPGSDTVLGYAKGDADATAITEAFLNHALPIAIQVALRRQALHASAVLSPGGVAVFCGGSHSGKSTIAHGLSRRGHALWADDVVAFATQEVSGVKSLRVPFKPNLRPASADYFRQERRGQSPARTAEWDMAPVSFLCLLQVQPHAIMTEEISIKRLSPSQAFLPLVNHAWTFEPLSPKAKRQMISDYLEIVASAPVFRLCYQKDFVVLPRVLDAIEETMSASS